MWADKNKRAAGRQICADGIDGDFANCTVVADRASSARRRGRYNSVQPPGWTAIGFKTRIRLDRFKPTSTGHRLLPAALVAVFVASTAVAHAETWFTILVDRGCIISQWTPEQFQRGLVIKGYADAHEERKYFPNGTLMGVDVANADQTGERNQWFFPDPQTCLAAAQLMGVQQQ
jgi:hypothetical protein